MKKILPIVLYSGILSLQGSVGTLNQDVKIREYPDMKSKVVATRKKGKSFEILDRFETKKDNLWYLTEKGYIYYQFIDLDEPFINTNKRSQEYFEEVVEQLQTRPFETIVTKEEIIKDVYNTNFSLPIIQPDNQQKQEEINIAQSQIQIDTTIKEQNLTKTEDQKSLEFIKETETKDNNLTEPIILHSQISSFSQESIQNSSSIQTQKEHSKDIEKEKILNDYKKGLEFYKAKQYKEAYEILNILFETNLNDPNINFYLGRSAFELGLYDEAILAYERVLFEKPESFRVEYELGKVYLAKNELLQSKQFFEKVVQNKETPKELKLQSEMNIAYIEKKIKKDKFGGVAIIGINYDSNINQRAKSDYFDIPSGTPIPNPTKKESAVAHQEVIVANYSYKLNDRATLKTDLIGFGKFMFDSDLDDKNIKMVSLTQSVLKQYTEQLGIEYGVFIDNLWMDDKNYMKTYGLAPKFNFIQNEQSTIDGYIKYQIKKYQQQANQTNDSKYSEVGTKYSYILNQNFTLIPNIIYSNEKANNQSTTGVDNYGYTIGLDTNFVLKPTLIFAPSLSYKKVSYDTREEKQKYLKLGTTYIYSPEWILQSELSYTNQNSNIQAFSYEKYNFGINLIRPF